MSYNIIPITVMVSSRSQVDASNLLTVSTSKKPQIVAEEIAILAISFIDSSGNAYVLGRKDTFELGGDLDYVHFSAEGTLSGSLTAGATITSITAQSSLSVKSTGHLVLTNAAGQSERIQYTAYNSTSKTFTVASYPLLYSYMEGDSLEVEDELMLYSGNEQADIAGDWSGISRAQGKISIRIDAGADIFKEKLDGNASKSIHLELRRYPYGESTPTVMYRDDATAYNTVINGRSRPATTSLQFLTPTSGDARYVKNAPELFVADMTISSRERLIVGSSSSIKSFDLSLMVYSASQSNLVKLQVANNSGALNHSKPTFTSSIAANDDTAQAEIDAARTRYAVDYEAYLTAKAAQEQSFTTWRATPANWATWQTLDDAGRIALFPEINLVVYERSAAKDANGYYTYAATDQPSIVWTSAAGKWIMGTYNSADGWWESDSAPSASKDVVFTVAYPSGVTPPSPATKQDKTLSFHGYDPATLPAYLPPFPGFGYQYLPWIFFMGVVDGNIEVSALALPTATLAAGAASGLSLSISTLNIMS